MKVTRVARGNKRTRRGRKKMSDRFLPIDRPFDSPPPELNDEGGQEGTAIGIDVTYTQWDDDASIWSNEGSSRVEKNMYMILCQHI